MAPVKGCCDFCGRASNDVLYGPIHRLRDIKCHYYCLLFSSNLDQNGKDDEGILGFLLRDIKKELTRAKNVKCSYCHKPGGFANCHFNRCKKRFHLPCGMERGSLHLFFSDFRSYCGDHRTKQRVPASILKSNDATCSICFEPMKNLTSIDSIWAPCCKKNGWFHRLCIQKFALNAAYFFKCPLCANQDKFRNAMLKNGIYIPDQDASWELEPNAYEELLERHQQCDSASCKCPQGRNYTSEGSRYWNLILCRNCGSRGIHVGCIPGPKSSLDRRTFWDCSDCNETIKGKRHLEGQHTTVNISCHVNDDDDDEDEEIIVVDDDMEEFNNDKVGDVSNADFSNPDIKHILSNVINLKSTSVDYVDLVSDEIEGMEAKVIDDDEMQCLLDESETINNGPSISETNEERNIDYGIEVGKHVAHQSSPIDREECILWQGEKTFPRRSKTHFTPTKHRTSFSKLSDSINIFNRSSSNPCDYVGLRSPGSFKRFNWYRNGSKCLDCMQMMEARVGNLYDNLLFDGLCEIVHHSSKSLNCNNALLCREMCKLHWARKAKWVCGLTTFLSEMRQSRIVRSQDFFSNYNSKPLNQIEVSKFYNLVERRKLNNEYFNSIPEITVQFLN